jgi:hypothetical protein
LGADGVQGFQGWQGQGVENSYEALMLMGG